MHDLIHRLRRLIGIGQLNLVDDTGAQQKTQMQIGVGGPAVLQEIIDQLTRLSEYGFASNPPLGSPALALFLGGRRSEGVIIATGDAATRLTNLLAGEAALYNGVKGTFAKMADDGTLQINCPVVITNGGLTATGDILDHSSDGKGATMEAMRQTHDTHTHPAGSPNTGVPNQQEPD